MMDDFRIGGESPNPYCCGKPFGCTNVDKNTCSFPRHPWKRAVVLGDTTIPCPAIGIKNGKEIHCSLMANHEGKCVTKEGE